MMVFLIRFWSVLVGVDVYKNKFVYEFGISDFYGLVRFWLIWLKFVNVCEKVLVESWWLRIWGSGRCCVVMLME